MQGVVQGGKGIFHSDKKSRRLKPWKGALGVSLLARNGERVPISQYCWIKMGQKTNRVTRDIRETDWRGKTPSSKNQIPNQKGN